MWLVNTGVITNEESKRLEEVYSHRHELTHELVNFLVDTNAVPDLQLFADALAILKKIHLFWVQIELDSGGFFIPETGDWVDDVEADEVVPLSLELLYLCISALDEATADQ